MSTDTHTHTQSIKIALLNWPSWPCRCRNNVCACVEGGRVRHCDHSQHSVKSYHRLQPVIMSSSNHCVCVCVCPSEVLQNSHYFVTRVIPAKRDYIRDQTQDTRERTHLWTPPRAHTAAHTSGKSVSLKLSMLFTVLQSQHRLWPVLAVSLSPQPLMNWHNSKITSASPSYSEVGWPAGRLRGNLPRVGLGRCSLLTEYDIHCGAYAVGFDVWKSNWCETWFCQFTGSVWTDLIGFARGKKLDPDERRASLRNS